MNVFICEVDPRESAKSLSDKHVVKMVVETTQILSSVCALRNVKDESLYRPTHTGHPVVVRSVNDDNYLRWVIDHGKALLSEYIHRYGRLHASSTVMLRAEEILTTHFDVPDVATFDEAWPKCVLDEFRGDSLVTAYRKHLIQKYNRWARQPKWTNREYPTWLRVQDRQS